MLITFIILYLLVSVAIGLWAAKRVRNTTDYALAGRHLSVTTVAIVTFATWFGSELVLGVSAEFVEGGLAAVVKDPFGAGLCLILVGMFFARKLYQKTLLTLSDYYRQRFGRNIEIICSLIIIFSYLGWVAAQITALGLVFNMLSQGQIPFLAGMLIGTVVVLVYTLYGGMWSVALTDTIQMIVIVVGLLAVAWFAADLAGGASRVIEFAASEGKFKFFPDFGDGRGWLFFIASLITMMLGSIPQQDVFQRVMAANSADAAARGPILGGAFYILFGFVPMFIAMAAMLIMPGESARWLQEDAQYILPTLVLEHMPFVLQVAFFGALLSAITSTTSATLLAPSTTFVENILRNIKPHMTDAQTLRAMRISVPVFTLLVLLYAITMEGRSIYELVAEAYQLPLVGAFVPLVFGLYWRRATTQGAIFAVLGGFLVWGSIALSSVLVGSSVPFSSSAVVVALADFGDLVPQQLAGVVAAAVAMVVGSLMPQFLRDVKEEPHQLDAATPLSAT